MAAKTVTNFVCHSVTGALHCLDNGSIVFHLCSLSECFGHLNAYFKVSRIEILQWKWDCEIVRREKKSAWSVRLSTVRTKSAIHGCLYGNIRNDFLQKILIMYIGIRLLGIIAALTMWRYAYAPTKCTALPNNAGGFSYPYNYVL